MITVDLPIARFADTIDVVGETTAVSNGRTLAPVEAIASRALDEFVPGQGFQGAIRMLSTAMPVSGGVSIKGGRPGQAGVQLGTTTLVDPASGVAQVPLPDGAIESVTVLPNPYAVEYRSVLVGTDRHPVAPRPGSVEVPRAPFRSEPAQPE